jgi:hypothetical protein
MHIVDDLLADIYGWSVVFQGFLNSNDSPVHAGTIATGSRQQNLLRSSNRGRRLNLFR